MAWGPYECESLWYAEIGGDEKTLSCLKPVEAGNLGRWARRFRSMTWIAETFPWKALGSGTRAFEDLGPYTPRPTLNSKGIKVSQLRVYLNPQSG